MIAGIVKEFLMRFLYYHNVPLHERDIYYSGTPR